jgi:hypothetical protein
MIQVWVGIKQDLKESLSINFFANSFLAPQKESCQSKGEKCQQLCQVPFPLDRLTYQDFHYLHGFVYQFYYSLE